LVNYSKKREKFEVNRIQTAANRKKGIDMESLSIDQIVHLSASIGKKINQILGDAQKQVQAILDVYGSTLILEYKLLPKESPKKEEIAEAPVNTEESEIKEP